jgi:hypothetical protein
VWILVLGVTACTTEPEVTTTDELLRKNAGFIPNGVLIPNDAGWSTTNSKNGRIDLNNEFFQDVATNGNGRRCVTCHLPTAGWGVTPDQMQIIFDATNGGRINDGFGLGAAFRTNDGSNRPNYTTAELSTLEGRRAAYSMLLNHGLIRVGIGIPTGADFALTAVDDPYGYASAAELSLFRRPLPTTNLDFIATVMWDGRETFAGKSIHFDLSDQSNGATQGHAASTNPLSDAQRTSIVNFETGIATAQQIDNAAGALNQDSAKGGAQQVFGDLASFYIGKNDNTGDYKTNAPFNEHVFNLYDGWKNSSKSSRRAIQRGQEIFNSKQFTISGVAGLNGMHLPHMAEGAVLPDSFSGTCTTCHNGPNAGNHTISAPLNIGLVDESVRTADMPLYTLTCNDGSVHKVTDPGRALISGKCADIGKFKGPVLRALASRAPYFHNGLAADLDAVVNFYNTRFAMNLSSQEKSDLAAFLATL